jgi:hypothetical protein
VPWSSLKLEAGFPDTNSDSAKRWKEKKTKRYPCKLGVSRSNEEHRNHRAENRGGQSHHETNHHDYAGKERNITVDRLQCDHREDDRREPAEGAESYDHTQTFRSGASRRIDWRLRSHGVLIPNNSATRELRYETTRGYSMSRERRPALAAAIC